MAAKKPRRAHAQTERASTLQALVDQQLTLKAIGQRMGGISGERVRQLIVQLQIKGAPRKRGRRPKPIGQTAEEIDPAALRMAYYGDPATSAAPVPLAPLAKRFGISTNRLRKVLKHLGLSARTPLPRPKRRAPRLYDIDEIRRLCIEERWSDQRIADHFRAKKGVKAFASYINLLRKKHGIKRDPLKAGERKNAKADVAERLEQLLRAGKTPKEIAHLIPCSASYVYRLATRYGLSHLLPRNRHDAASAA